MSKSSALIGGGLPKVCIVVLNWNNWRQTVACLESVAEQDYPNLMTVVLDNGSRDTSLEEINAWRDSPSAVHSSPNALRRFELLKSTTNLGFAGGCNLGIVRALSAGADYVLLLNNDARLAASAVARLVSVAINEDAAIT